MKCPSEALEGAEVLLAFGSGRLDAARMETLADHVGNCAACAELLAAQRSVDAALETWEAPAVSADFDRRLYRRIEREVPWWDVLVRPFRPAFARRVVPAAVAAALLLGAGIWIERPGSVPARPASAQIEALPPDQAETALRDMEVMQEFGKLVPADAGEPRL